ncbi:MAG: type I methionyl aminopeptidase [Planifilum fimeticola]
MTITLKSRDEIEKMHRSGRLLASCHRELARLIKPGITPLAIDRFVEEYLRSHGATPEQKGYMGYPYATCCSKNDVVCHGMPDETPLREGDIVTIDMVVNIDGWLADSAWTYPVGTISSEARRLLDATRESLYRGIAQAKAGNRLGDISHAIQSFAESQGYSVVRQFVGHGIGRRMHEDPQVPHFGKPNQGVLLKPGMVIIEPMLNVGGYQVKIDDDGWTARTVDGSLSAQYEHTVAITEEGPLILTEQ